MMAAGYSIIHFILLARSFPNIYYVVQPEFQDRYAAGFNFYVRLLMMIATAYYWGCAKIAKKHLLLGLVCLIPNALTFVKGIVFIPCLASILLRMKNGELKISLRAVLAIICIGIGVFFGVYLVEMGIYNPDILFKADTYKIIGTKLVNYLIAGVQSFSQNILDNNISRFRSADNITLAPLTNFLAKFGVEEKVETLCNIWQRFGYSATRKAMVESNVNTYIGTIYLYNGFALGILLNCFWVFLASFLNEIFERNRGIGAALSGLFCAAFALGWFDDYFIQTFWAYLIVIAIAIHVILAAKAR